MIKLYGGVYSRGAMVMFALEALGLEYEFEDMTARCAASQTEQYRELNPTGKIPTLVDDELVLWESQAILFYLAQKYGDNKLWADSAEAVAEIYRWSLFISNQLEAVSLDMLLQFKFNKNQPDTEVIAQAEKELSRFLPVLDQHLDGREFLAADHLTVADMHGAQILSWPKLAGFDYSAYPNVHSWIKRMLAHPAHKRVMAHVGR